MFPLGQTRCENREQSFLCLNSNISSKIISSSDSDHTFPSLYSYMVGVNNTSYQADASYLYTDGMNFCPVIKSAKADEPKSYFEVIYFSLAD